MPMKTLIRLLEQSFTHHVQFDISSVWKRFQYVVFFANVRERCHRTFHTFCNSYISISSSILHFLSYTKQVAKQALTIQTLCYYFSSPRSRGFLLFSAKNAAVCQGYDSRFMVHSKRLLGHIFTKRVVTRSGKLILKTRFKRNVFFELHFYPFSERAQPSHTTKRYFIPVELLFSTY